MGVRFPHGGPHKLNEMTEQYFVIDNVFDDPDEISELAKQMEYYTNEDRMLDGIKLATDSSYFPESFWRGFRSKDLMLFENGPCNFNIIPEFVNYGIDQKYWWHKDLCTWAGVIYLTKNPEPDSGTIIVIDDKEIVVENVYNRLVCYSNVLHRPQRYFGTNLNNSRITMTFFL